MRIFHTGQFLRNGGEGGALDVYKRQDFAEVTGRIKEDPYFSHDLTQVIRVDDVGPIKVTGHGVKITRAGSSGTAHNQLLRCV